LGGKVVGVNKNAGAWGNQVVVQYPGGATLSFNHLSGFGKIKRGQSVPQGYVLGQVGDTGQTTGSHLDLEATLNGVSVPLASAFKGYQFDSAYKGGEYGVKGSRGYNRSENKFYDLNKLGVGTKETFTASPSPSPSAAPAPTPTPKTSVNPSRTAVTFNDAPNDVPSGSVNLSALQPNSSKQFSKLTGIGNIPKVG
jgi:murein DD-endopeptidase MepM/ murein hydrolase activator NlpD